MRTAGHPGWSLEGKPTTLDLVLRNRAEQQPDRLAYTYLLDGEAKEVNLTYGELDRQARTIGAVLQGAGAAYERVLLLYPPGIEFIPGFFGTLYAGAIPVPTYPPDPTRLDRTLPRFRTTVRDAQAKLVITTSQVKRMAQFLFDQAPELKTLQWLSTDDLRGGLEFDWRPPQRGVDDLAFIQYSSGTGGTPKGVMVSHRNALLNLVIIQWRKEETPDDIGCSWLPVYHDMGLFNAVLLPAFVGYPSVLFSPLDFLRKPARWVQAISRYRATQSGAPNFAYELVVRKTSPEQRASLDLSSWRCAFNGAEPIRLETFERFYEAFSPSGLRHLALSTCYGMAESVSILTAGFTSKEYHTARLDRAAVETGRALPAGPSTQKVQTFVSIGNSLVDDIAIVDPTTLTRCAPGHIGEIWAKGPSIAHSYWNLPNLTREILGAHLADTGEGPYLRTGDLGFLREDGALFFIGTLQDHLIIRGRHHYPQDIERTVQESHPQALRPGACAVFAVHHEGEQRLVIVQELSHEYKKRSPSSEKTDQSGTSLSVIHPHTLPDPQQLIEGIRKAVAQEHELEVHAVALIQAGTILKTSSGKIQRLAVRQALLDDTLRPCVYWQATYELATAPADPKS